MSRRVEAIHLWPTHRRKRKAQQRRRVHLSKPGRLAEAEAAAVSERERKRQANYERQREVRRQGNRARLDAAR